MPVLTVVPSSFIDTAIASDKTTRIITSPFARIQVSTLADSCDITIFNDYSFAYLSQLGIYVNGVYNQTVTVLANSGSQVKTVALPAGAKTVDFVNGPCSNFSNTNADASLTSCNGTWITSLDFNAAFTQLFPALTPKVVVWGDSIAVGDGAEGTPTGAPQQKAWPMQVRLAYGGQLAVEGWGARKLFDDAGDATKRARFVSLMVIHNPSIIILACGTNDYGLNSWSASSFGTAYGATLDDLHTALPAAKIVAMTPFLRATETANGSGSTLQDYRDQISAAAAARPSYVTRVDGRYILDLATDFRDNPHPNGGGNTKIANYILAHLAGVRRFRATTS